MISISSTIGNILILVIIFHLLNVKCFSLTKSEKIDSLMQEYYKRDLFNGSILVTEYRKIVYKKSFGYSNIETKEELNDSTIFNLASLTKQFTATAIMILFDRDELFYDDELVKYIPELKPIANRITIRHLLNHTSGLPEYLEENIFKPLLMKNTFVYAINKREIKNLAIGYKEDKTIDKYEIFTYGDGNIYSTIQDMFKWEQSLYTEKLVKATTLMEAFKKSELNNGNKADYGYGWNICESNQVVYHRGGWAGANTSITRYIDDQDAIIILSNFTPTNDNNMFIIESAIEDILANRPISSPQFGR